MPRRGTERRHTRGRSDTATAAASIDVRDHRSRYGACAALGA